MRDALGLLTTLGRRGGALRPRALLWFPAVGGALGLIVGAAAEGAERWWPAPVVAGLVMAVNLALTGLLHVDGLADSADGLLPHADRERRLEIMRGPDVGAFGVAVVGIVFLLQFAALTANLPSLMLFVAIWCTTRSVVAGVPAAVPYARDHGIASALVVDASRLPWLAIPAAAALAATSDGIAGLAAVLAALAGGAAVVALARRRIGGFTGDVLGAAIVVGETAALVVASARW